MTTNPPYSQIQQAHATLTTIRPQMPFVAWLLHCAILLAPRESSACRSQTVGPIQLISFCRRGTENRLFAEKAGSPQAVGEAPETGPCCCHAQLAGQDGQIGEYIPHIMRIIRQECRLSHHKKHVGRTSSSDSWGDDPHCGLSAELRPATR